MNELCDDPIASLYYRNCRQLGERTWKEMVSKSMFALNLLASACVHMHMAAVAD